MKKNENSIYKKGYKTEIGVVDPGIREIPLLRELPVIRKAAELLKVGQVVAFPTETVYGLGGDAGNPEVIEKIFQAKGRPQDNPLIVHVASKEQLETVSDSSFNEDTLKLLEAFWPGPLTIITDKGGMISDRTTSGLDSMAVRFPSHPVARALIEEADLPLAAPSANISGAPSPTTAEHVYNDLQGRIPLIIDGGPSWIGIESTVLDTRSEAPVILRPGGISQEEIEKILGKEIRISPSESDNKGQPLSPGMKYRHYSPATSLILAKTREELLEKIKEYSSCNTKVILSEESREQIKELLPAGMEAISMGPLAKPEIIAGRIFALLRELDRPELDYIIVEGIPEKGIGLAVMNRLYRASSRE